MAFPKIDTILYTTSLGKHSRPVFRHAANLAQQFQAKVIMLHVIEPIGELGQALIHNYFDEKAIQNMHDEGIEVIRNQMRERVEEYYRDELKSMEDSVSIDVEHVVSEGNHTDTILKEARLRRADMIIMGSENRLGHHSMTTQQVMRHAKVPVLVVPTGKKYL